MEIRLSSFFLLPSSPYREFRGRPLDPHLLGNTVHEDGHTSFKDQSVRAKYAFKTG